MKSGLHPSLEFGAGSEEVTSVGANLRSCRLRQGKDLQQISNVLRIRYDYLQAIEDGRLEDLPGPIYSTGFIRTYSEYLGLDGEQIIQRLKTEVTVLAESPKLVFPAIIPEDGIPGGTIVMFGLLIACIGYFTWYWSTSSERFVAESVPTMPKEMAELTQTKAKQPPLAVNNSLVEASSAVAAPAKLHIKPSQNDLEPEKFVAKIEIFPESKQNSAKIVTAPQAPKTLGSEFAQIEPSSHNKQVVSGGPRTLTPPDNTEKEIEKFATPPLGSRSINSNLATENQEAFQNVGNIALNQDIERTQLREQIARDAKNNLGPIKSNSLAKPNPVQAAFDDNAPDTLSKLPDRVHIEVAALADTRSRSSEVVQTAKPPINKKQPGALNKDNRIKIIAINTSWIQLRDIKENRIILSKVLPKGQSYKVPSEKRLSLMTGNAGALKIIVDGEPVPSIGKLGEVRRKVLLEVESLKLGRAVVE